MPEQKQRNPKGNLSPQKKPALEVRSELNVNGLAVTKEGQGPRILFLHGIGSSRVAFRHQLTGLSPYFTCYAPDAPGYGDSKDFGALDDIDAYAAIYESLIDGEDISALVGVSFGGVVASRIAIRGNVQLDALVLADSSRGSGVNDVRAQAMRERSNLLLMQGANSFARQRAHRLVSPSASKHLVQQVEETMSKAIRMPGYGQATRAMAATDHGPLLSKIHTPTLIVVGGEDAVCPPAESRHLHKLIPNSLYQEIPGAGHLANQERPTDFNYLLKSFLTENLGSTIQSGGQKT